MKFRVGQYKICTQYIEYNPNLTVDWTDLIRYHYRVPVPRSGMRPTLQILVHNTELCRWRHE